MQVWDVVHTHHVHGTNICAEFKKALDNCCRCITCCKVQCGSPCLHPQCEVATPCHRQRFRTEHFTSISGPNVHILSTISARFRAHAIIKQVCSAWNRASRNDHNAHTIIPQPISGDSQLRSVNRHAASISHQNLRLRSHTRFVTPHSNCPCDVFAPRTSVIPELLQ